MSRLSLNDYLQRTYALPTRQSEATVAMQAINLPASTPQLQPAQQNGKRVPFCDAAFPVKPGTRMSAVEKSVRAYFTLYNYSMRGAGVTSTIWQGLEGDFLVAETYISQGLLYCSVKPRQSQSKRFL